MLSNQFSYLNTGGEDGILGGEFTLTGIDGDVSLSDFKGKVVMLYFGFVQCSEVCPTSMRVMAQTFAMLDDEEISQVQVVLISIDVEEDSFAEVDEYAKRFHQNFIGLTGTIEQIDQVIAEYGAYYNKTELAQTDKTRAFRHSSRYFIVNKQGDLIAAMRHSSTANELHARLLTLI